MWQLWQCDTRWLAAQPPKLVHCGSHMNVILTSLTCTPDIMGEKNQNVTKKFSLLKTSFYSQINYIFPIKSIKINVSVTGTALLGLMWAGSFKNRNIFSDASLFRYSQHFFFIIIKINFYKNVERISISGSVPAVEYCSGGCSIYRLLFRRKAKHLHPPTPSKYMVEEERRWTKERSTYWHSISVVNRICTSYRYVAWLWLWLWLWFFSAGLQMRSLHPPPPTHKARCRNAHLS